MKSVKVPELMEHLEDMVRPIDKPRSDSEDEVVGLVEIAELESQDSENLDEVIERFKSHYKIHS